MDAVLRGDFRQLPHQDSNIVRVFISSTFGDFTVERNQLACKTFSQLQSYCQRIGLEFQVVDMRWGVRDENVSFHQTSEVCIQEIHNCQRLSIGPSFLALVGDRYGYRPFPAEIPVDEFGLFVDLACSHEVNIEHLLKWYTVDYNAVDPVFQLAPITQHFPNYSSTDQRLRCVDRDGWWETFMTLQATLWKLVKLAVHENMLPEERAQIYLQSVTEDEIHHGILSLSSVSSKKSALCYSRTLIGLEDHLDDKSASKYIDVLQNVPPYSVDTEAQSYLRALKHQKLPHALSSSVHSYSIPWLPGGVTEECPEHRDYLQQLCEQVWVDMKHLIDEAVDSRNMCCSVLHAEVLHHASLCMQKCDMYCDRNDDVMMKIQHYVQSKASHVLIVHGKSGSGKTCVMAKAAGSVLSWTTGEACLVVRFLGTSPGSSAIRGVLISICDQICTLYSLSHPNFNRLDTVEIIQYFRHELWVNIGQIPNISVILMLDSVDQLSPTDGAYSMKWLPLSVPSNARIIVSMLNEKLPCFENSRLLFPDSKASYIELGSMCVSTGLEIINDWLRRAGRKITTEQNELVSKAFAVCPRPLFLKLIFSHARAWRSYTDIQSIELTLPSSVESALNQFYQGIEQQFGRILVAKALGYFTCAKHGLTEAELENVLSLDNEVLNDCYQYWDPPMNDVIRIPSLLWKRIRHFISDYIAEQQADGLTVLAWYHRQFNESAVQRYVNTSSCESLHLVLSQYFEGIWGNGRGKSIKLEHRGLFLKDASRQVPLQPLMFSEGVYNFQKLSELPYHLLFSYQLERLKSCALCNFEWVFTKLKATGYSTAVQDYIITLQENPDERDVSTICEALSLSSSIVRRDPNNLAGQLIGRLLSSSHSLSVHTLLDGASNWTKSTTGCTFQPLNNCLVAPGGELKATISGHHQVIVKVAKSPTLPVLVSYSKCSDGDVFNVWDLASLECIENICKLELAGVSLKEYNYCLTCEHIIAVNTESYSMWNVRTGDCTNCIKYSDDGFRLSCLASTCDGDLILLGTETGKILFTNASSIKKFSHSIDLERNIKSIHITPDGKYAVVLSGIDCVVTILCQSRIILYSTTFDHTDLSVIDIVESHDGRYYVAAGTKTGATCSSSIPNLDFIFTRAHTKEVKCITCVSSLGVMVTGSLDKLLCVWDITRNTVTKQLAGHMDGVWCLDAIPKTTMVVSGSKDDYLKVWNVVSGDCLHTLEGHSSWISCVVAVASDLVVSGSNDKNLKVWKLSSQRKSFDSSSRHLAQPECIVLSSFGVAASGGPDAIKLWNPNSGECLHSSPVPTSALIFTNDLKSLVVGSRSGEIVVFNVDNNFAIIKNLKKHTSKVTTLFSLSQESHGKCIILASLDCTMRIWSKDYEDSVVFSHTGGVVCVTCSQDELTVASGSLDSKICLWNLTYSECTGILEGHSKTVNCLKFNDDNSRLISGSDDTYVCVWNISEMCCIYRISYSDSIKTLCFVDGGVFVAGAHCGRDQLKSWNLDSGKCLSNFVGHTHAVMCMSLLNNYHIITGSRDGTVRAWNLESSTMLCSFDLQSQVKHISTFKLSALNFVVGCTTKSGPLAFLKLNIS